MGCHVRGEEMKISVWGKGEKEYRGMQQKKSSLARVGKKK